MQLHAKNDTKKQTNPEPNTSANDTKAMAGNMLWQEVTFKSGRYHGHVFYSILYTEWAAAVEQLGEKAQLAIL